MSDKMEYETTHPWLTVSLDLRKLPYTFWVQLGAIQSKCRHVGDTMLAPRVQKTLFQVYLAKGAHATTAIEGNTLSEEQVLDVVRGEHSSLPSKQYLEDEVQNVIDACRQMRSDAQKNQGIKLSRQMICDLNRQVLKGLEAESHVQPGETRQCSVGVFTYRGAPHQDCDHLLDRLCDFLNNDFTPPSEEVRTGFAVIKAILAHLYIAWIHPFGDGNGRTARLLEFAILMDAGVPDVSSHLLSNHYNQTRSQYYRELDYASKSNGDVTKFLSYAAIGMRDGLVEQIDRINDMQYRSTWREFVYEKMRDDNTPVLRRQRKIAIALVDHHKGVPVPKIRHLTPQIAVAYAGKQDRAVRRDIARLQEIGLIHVDEGVVKMHLHPLAERLPWRVLRTSAASTV